MLTIRKGRYEVRLAAGDDDLRAAQRLRWLCFVGNRRPAAAPEAGQTGTADHGADDGADHGKAAAANALDADAHDSLCSHVLIEDRVSGQLVACFRLLVLSSGAEIQQSYSAQYYDLSALVAYDAPMIEVGRFCVHPAHSDPDILRIAWAALSALVDKTGAGLLFGCSSFMGTDAAGHADAFAMLRQRHLAPRRWLPRVKAPEVFRFARLWRRRPDARHAMALMPPLLRTYLMMGGWVSDHAVMDRQLDTMHVFTGLEIAAIPPARARALRLLAG